MVHPRRRSRKFPATCEFTCSEAACIVLLGLIMVARDERVEQASVRCMRCCVPAPGVGLFGGCTLRQRSKFSDQQSPTSGQRLSIGSPRAAVHEHCEHLSPSVC